MLQAGRTGDYDAPLSTWLGDASVGVAATALCSGWIMRRGKAAWRLEGACGGCGGKWRLKSARKASSTLLRRRCGSAAAPWHRNGDGRGRPRYHLAMKG